MSETKPKFNMKREPQPTVEEMAKLMSDAPNVVMSEEFQKILYQIWAAQDELQKL